MLTSVLGIDAYTETQHKHPRLQLERVQQQEISLNSSYGTVHHYRVCRRLTGSDCCYCTETREIGLSRLE